MPKFSFNVEVECDTLEEAQQVAAERMGYDEDLGFEYRIGYEDVTPVYGDVKATVNFTDSEKPMPYIEARFGAVGVSIVRTGTTGATIINIEPVTEDEVTVKLVTHGQDEVTTLRFNEK